jgi:hypothetical protein
MLSMALAYFLFIQSSDVIQPELQPISITTAFTLRLAHLQLFADYRPTPPMPVSFPVAMHPAKPSPFPDPWAGHTATEVFRAACQDQFAKAGEILQFSLPRANGKDVEES